MSESQIQPSGMSLKLRRFPLGVITAGVTLGLGAVLGEAFLAVAYRVRDQGPPPSRPIAARDAPYLYYLPEPDPAHGVNDDGLYSTKPVRKPPGALRVVLVGGSVARSGSVSPENGIAGRLEALLRERLGPKLEVLNAGVDGYVLEQEFLLVQLVLQHYSPDVVVGLEGYNDVVSFEQNRTFPGFRDNVPQHWRVLRSIEQRREQGQLSARLGTLFPNLARASGSARRLLSVTPPSIPLGPEDLERRARAYLAVLDDLHSFCAAKGMQHFSFLQPVSFYPPPPSLENARLYALMERGVEATGYGRSLAALLRDNRSLFVDDCHFADAGNQIVARAMAAALVDGPQPLRTPPTQDTHQ